MISHIYKVVVSYQDWQTIYYFVQPPTKQQLVEKLRVPATPDNSVGSEEGATRATAARKMMASEIERYGVPLMGPDVDNAKVVFRSWFQRWKQDAGSLEIERISVNDNRPVSTGVASGTLTLNK